jgi:hypothetical protein|tara:strand:+ start:1221 stop:1460 length:240 start_codon:yes stop_codon:yes gene_type:complete
MSKIKEYLISFWNWLKSFFVTNYKLSVSYNATWGDKDDQIFVVKKFYNKQDKYIRFKTQNDEIVEIRGAEGLNYKIEEL